jgi:hypothetical protein
LGELDGGVASVVGAQLDEMLGGVGAERDARVLALPSGSWASDAARAVSRVAWAYGE